MSTCWAGGGNFSIPLPGGPGPKTADSTAGFEDELSRTIVDCEVNSGAWTLMHRYNKAADLLAQVLAVQSCLPPPFPLPHPFALPLTISPAGTGPLANLSLSMLLALEPGICALMNFCLFVI